MKAPHGARRRRERSAPVCADTRRPARAHGPLCRGCRPARCSGRRYRRNSLRPNGARVPIARTRSAIWVAPSSAERTPRQTERPDPLHITRARCPRPRCRQNRRIRSLTPTRTSDTRDRQSRPLLGGKGHDPAHLIGHRGPEVRAGNRASGSAIIATSARMLIVFFIGRYARWFFLPRDRQNQGILSRGILIISLTPAYPRVKRTCAQDDIHDQNCIHPHTPRRHRLARPGGRHRRVPRGAGHTDTPSRHRTVF